MAVSGALVAAPAASAAKIQVGVAPSPNGYVMAGVPTQVAVNRAAKVYRNVNGKWMLLGNATKARSVPVTFNDPGVYSLRVKPKKGKARVVKVGVYGYFSIDGSGSTIAMGGQVFPNGFGVGTYAISQRVRRVSIPAYRGCVNVDVGVKEINQRDSYPYEAKVDVFSAGSPAWSSGLQSAPEGFAALGIPISGDAALEFFARGRDVRGSVKALCLQ